MFALVCVTLFFSYTAADSGASVVEQIQHCNAGFCVSLTEQISAEAGLCVVIPCSFSAPSYFTSQHLIWFKCEPTKKCSDSDIIFSNNNDITAQTGFMGRVSLLVPDINQNNCSIIVNNLKESDSGSYQLRVNGLLIDEMDGFLFRWRTTVFVKDLSQKPTVMVPPLTAGQQNTLTCTAPGLCSGSVPQITWTWRKPGENNSYIPGNITDTKTENLSDVTQRHSSTLTFNLSAEHHNTEVTCKVNFRQDKSTQETVTLNVTYVRVPEISGKTTVAAGDSLNLTCRVQSFPPALITWTKRGFNETLSNRTDIDENNNTASASLFIPNVPEKLSGRYICTVKHLDSILTRNINISVIYIRVPQISGETTVQAGDSLNLTCRVQSFPPALITWTKFGFNETLSNRTDIDENNNTASASLFIPNVTEEQSGQYICTVKHLDTVVPVQADVNVTRFPRILSSHCEIRSEVLSCVCVGDGFPLPTITWPLLQNHTEYSIITVVSKNTINSTVSVAAKHHDNGSVECVAANNNGRANKTLSIKASESQQEVNSVMRAVSRLETIVAFLIGVLLSAVVCCFVRNCHRRKKLISGNLETLQMISSQEDPLIYDGPAAEYDQIHVQQGIQDQAEIEEKLDLEYDRVEADVQYASINFSLLKSKNDRKAAKRESTDTEYAEIKKQGQQDRKHEDNAEEEEEMLDDKEEEAEVEENEETQCCVPGQEE